MAVNYNIEDIIACIATLEPIAAAEIQQLALLGLTQLGESPDPGACRWTGRQAGNCNLGTIRTAIVLMENVGDLQQIEDCAFILGVLDADESSDSTSSEGTSSSSSSSSSHTEDCALWVVPTPQSFETDTSTSLITMHPVVSNPVWDELVDASEVIIGVRSTNNCPGQITTFYDGSITYQPLGDGSEAGSVCNIELLIFDFANTCSITVHLHIVITEQTTD